MSTFDEDINAMQKQVTQEVIFYINKNPEVYRIISDITKEGLTPEQSVLRMKQEIYKWADEHDNEFGTVFQAELDGLNNDNWVQVAAGI